MMYATCRPSPCWRVSEPINAWDVFHCLGKLTFGSCSLRHHSCQALGGGLHNASACRFLEKALRMIEKAKEGFERHLQVLACIRMMPPWHHAFS